jgi:hypothetical protein
MASVCSRCKAKLRFRVTTFMNLPQDARDLVSVLRGEINNFSCEVCANVIQLRPPLLIYHPAAAELLVASLSPDGRENLREIVSARGVEPLFFDDYEGLQSGLEKRATQYLRAALAQATAMGELKPPKQAPYLIDTPFILLLLWALSEGILLGGIPSESPMGMEQQRDVLAQLLAATVIDCIGRLFTSAFHDGGVQTVLDVAMST